jgi:general stress protein 26
MMTEAPSQDTQKVAGLIRGSKLAMLTTTAPDGTLTSRPMGLQETDFDGSLWFFLEHSSRKVAHIAVHPQVNVTVSAPVSATWVSLTGTGTVVDDPARKRELWNAGVEAWFPHGPDDTNIALLKVEASSAEYWDSPSGRLATLISFAKAKITGERYSGGENETVTMTAG